MSRKGENIYKRKDGRWEARYIRYRVNWKPKYASVYAKTYTEVRLKKKRAEEEAAVCEIPQAGGRVRFSEMSSAWFYSIRPGIKSSSCAKYRNILSGHIDPWFRNVYLSDVNYSMLSEFSVYLLTRGGKKGAGMSQKSVADIFAVIRSILKFARKNGHRTACDGTEIRIRQKRKETKILSREDQEKLMRYLLEHLTSRNLGILISLCAGLRVGEVCALRWEDINREEKTIYIHSTMQRIQTGSTSGRKTEVVITSPKSACSVRRIPMPGLLSEVLDREFPRRKGFVLTGSEKKYTEPRTLEYHFRSVLQECGIGHTNFHALRHTFATRCVEVGFDVKCLSEILGHSNITITMDRYVHPSMQLKQDNMKKLEELFPVR